MNPYLRDFWATPSRYKILHGGRASSKSWDAAANAIRMAHFCKVKFLCVRQFQNKIAESVYSLLKIQIERFGLSEYFDIQASKIFHRVTGSEFIFYGIQRNLDEIKSVESVGVLWIEEAHATVREQMEILEPSIRQQGSEIWIVFNPKLINDYVYEHYVTNPQPDSVIKQINYDNNPFLSQTMLTQIEHLKNTDPDAYEHIYLGKPKGNDDRAIIKLKWINAAIDAHLIISDMDCGKSKLGFDVADDGGDACATIAVKGSIATECDEWHAGEDELLKSCSRAYNTARRLNAKINYDSIGVGATCGAKFHEINQARSGDSGYIAIKFDKFNAGSTSLVDPDGYYSDYDKITNKDKFANLKAQAWWLVADRLRNTYDYVVNGNHNYTTDELISIDGNMDNLGRLVAELSTPLRDVDNNGRDKVESKKDLLKRGVNSPNLADAFIMAFAPSDEVEFFVE